VFWADLAFLAFWAGSVEPVNLAPVVLIASCFLTAFVWRRGLVRYDSAST
jgi:hypothetical protein